MSNITTLKKIYIPIVVALLVTLVAGAWLITPALAASSGIQKMTARPLMSVGKVVEISSDRFTIERRDGSREIFLIDKDTRFIDRDKGTRMAFSDLDMDRFVIVGAKRLVEGNRTARLVILLPANFNPQVVVAVRGAITNVDTNAQTITLKNGKGEDFTFTVTSQTSFKGGITGLSSLTNGMTVAVSGEKLSNGSLQAMTVREVANITTREAGEITAIDETAGTITFKPLAADLSETTFVVDKDTRFRSLNGSVKSLADLKVGMMGIIFAKEPAAGSNEPIVTLMVIAKNQTPNTSELRVAGRVTAVNGNSFTIEGRDGKTYTFQIATSTIFRRRVGTAESLANLKVGMMVTVAAKDLGNNTFQAQVVVFVR